MPFPELLPPFARALKERDYLEPTSVQSAVLEIHTEGRDLLVSAQTGSGKTVAFGLAMAGDLMGESERLDPPGAPLALAIAPTRELALQVKTELEWLYEHTGAKIISCVGGMDIRREAANLIRGAHIVVGTPGRLRDHMEHNRLNVSSLRVAILDEADEMLNLGFREDLEFMLGAMPTEKRTLLFSATIPKEIASLAKRYQRDALRVDTVDHATPHNDIEYRAVRCGPSDVENTVVNLLRYFESPNTLVFCSTREGVKRLLARLLDRGFSAVSLSGEMSQNDRTSALQALRDGRAKVCVATDVAARGLDLPNLDLVIHADLPNDRETLLHRSGRTGRAGRKGVSALIVPNSRRRKAESLIDQAGIDANWGPPPSAEEIRNKDQERFLADAIFSTELTPQELEAAQNLLAHRSAEAVAAALIRLHRSRLPEPSQISVITDERRGERRERAPIGEGSARPSRPSSRRAEGPMVSFRLPLGRRQNADPRWLLPMICRLGNVTKEDIGAIRIFDMDTRFEIVEAVAARFAEAAKRPNDENIKITPADRESGDQKPAFRKAEGKSKPWQKSGPLSEQSPSPRAEVRYPYESKPAESPPKARPERKPAPVRTAVSTYDPIDRPVGATASDRGEVRSAYAPKPKVWKDKKPGFAKPDRSYDSAARKPEGSKPKSGGITFKKRPKP